jgi:hypothetical protein
MEGKGEEGRGGEGRSPIQSLCPRAQLVVWPPLCRSQGVGTNRIHVDFLVKIPRIDLLAETYNFYSTQQEVLKKEDLESRYTCGALAKHQSQDNRLRTRRVFGHLQFTYLGVTSLVAMVLVLLFYRCSCKFFCSWRLLIEVEERLLHYTFVFSSLYV